MSSRLHFSLPPYWLAFTLLLTTFFSGCGGSDEGSGKTDSGRYNPGALADSEIVLAPAEIDPSILSDRDFGEAPMHALGHAGVTGLNRDDLVAVTPEAARITGLEYAPEYRARNAEFNVKFG